jgi:hypothetical protein
MISLLGMCHVGQRSIEGDNMVWPPYWAAPELLDGEGAVNGRPPPSADVFSFALLYIQVGRTSYTTKRSLTSDDQICTGGTIEDIWKLAIEEILASPDGIRYGSGNWEKAWEVYMPEGSRPKRPSPEACKCSPMTDTLWTLVEDCWKRDPIHRSPSMDDVISRIEQSTQDIPESVNGSD